jgi:hypothetical protein
MRKYIIEQPDANYIIDKLGSNNKIAAKIGVSAAAISYWRENGIPELRLIQLKVLFPEELKGI